MASRSLFGRTRRILALASVMAGLVACADGTLPAYSSADPRNPRAEETPVGIESADGGITLGMP